MRILLKKVEPPPVVGDWRPKSGFLFLPKIINRELRWLEHARWKEQYKASELYFDEPPIWEPIYWVNWS